MKTRAVRIHGKNDLRLEAFDLPPMRDDEILAQIVTDSICMSTYKAAKQGTDHKRVPDDIAERPTMVGHEFSGRIVEVGSKWQDRFQPRAKFVVQPNLDFEDNLDAIGYSYEFMGGDATYVILSNDVMERGCLLAYEGEGYFPASLAEPMCCLISAFHSSYHAVHGEYRHELGAVRGGRMAVLAGAGPMGLGAVDYALGCDRRPSLLVVTDIDSRRLARAEKFFPVEKAAACGTSLVFVNTKDLGDVTATLLSHTDGRGYDDVFVMAAVKEVVECGDRIMGRDGCLNLFAGPTDPGFTAEINLYNVHYGKTHVMGTSGGQTPDMIEALDMTAKGLLNPAVMVTHIGGLDSAVATTLDLPNLPGGKKLIYTSIEMPLTAIDDFAAKGRTEPLYEELARITERHNGLWSVEAEEYLLANRERL